MRHPRSNRDIRDSLEVNKTEANYVGFCLIFRLALTTYGMMVAGENA